MGEDSIERLIRMIEAVGSFGKKEITEAFYWMILGDGYVEKKVRGNYALSVSHRTDCLDYLIWKASIINLVTGCSIKKQLICGSSLSQQHEMYRLRSSAHPWFTRARDRIYGHLNRKSIDPHALALLGPLGLAILYQDDGSFSYSKDAGRNVLIHKFCFSLIELEALAKTVVDKFGIIFRVNYCNGKGFRLRLRAKDIDKFFSLIEPYVVPSMLYKLGRGGADRVSDDVLWSLLRSREVGRNDLPSVELTD